VLLGVATDTGDAGQPVVEVDVPAYDADRLERALAAAANGSSPADVFGPETRRTAAL
jgi:hypothetical protein